MALGVVALGTVGAVAAGEVGRSGGAGRRRGRRDATEVIAAARARRRSTRSRSRAAGYQRGADARDGAVQPAVGVRDLVRLVRLDHRRDPPARRRSARSQRARRAPPHPPLRARASCWPSRRRRRARHARRGPRASRSRSRSGSGIGLTFDESALLLELEDVYWTEEGLVGVQITLAVASLLARSVLALRILRRGEAARTLRARPASVADAVEPSAAAPAPACGPPSAQITWSRPGPTPTSSTGTPTNSEMNCEVVARRRRAGRDRAAVADVLAPARAAPRTRPRRCAASTGGRGSRRTRRPRRRGSCVQTRSGSSPDSTSSFVIDEPGQPLMRAA